MATHDRDQPYAAVHSVAAAAAPVTGDAVHFTEEMPVSIAVLVQKTGTPTFSIVVEQSFDGAAWTQVGSAITAEGSTIVGAIAPYTRMRVVSVSGGSVDVYLAAAGQTTGQYVAGPTGPQGDPGAGGGFPDWFQSGSGSPVGVVTPVGPNRNAYFDKTNGALYVSVGATSADWVLLGGGNPGEDPGIRSGPNGGINILALGGPDSATLANDVQISDTVAQTGTGNGLYWIPGAADGEQHVDVYLGAGDLAFSLKADGGLQLPNGNSLYNTAAAPDNAVGADGDWSLGADGHIYFKTGGAWVQKV